MSEELPAEPPACRRRPTDLPSFLVIAQYVVLLDFPTNLSGTGTSPEPDASLPVREGVPPPNEMPSHARDTIQYEVLYIVH